MEATGGATPMTLSAGVTGANEGPTGVPAPQPIIMLNTAAPPAVIVARKRMPLVFGVFDMLFLLLSLGARSSHGSANDSKSGLEWAIPDHPTKLTGLLVRWGRGDERALDRLIPL